MSNVTFWALCTQHPPACMRAMSVGMTFGGLLAMGFGAVQMSSRPADSPRFSVTIFFLLAAAIQFLCLVAFLAPANGLSTFCRWWWRSMRGAHPASRQPFVDQPPDATHAESKEQGEAVLQDRQQSETTQLPQREVGGRYTRAVLFASCFWVYGSTYTLPTLLPFLADEGGDATTQQQLLLLLLILQNTGDVLGRLGTACIENLRERAAMTALLSAATFQIGTFTGLIALCILPASVSAGFTMYRQYILAVCCFCFYFSRGFLVTSLYLRARKLENAEALASNMGFAGQMGALLSNAVMFVLVNVFHTLGE